MFSPNWCGGVLITRASEWDLIWNMVTHRWDYSDEVTSVGLSQIQLVSLYKAEIGTRDRPARRGNTTWIQTERWCHIYDAKEWYRLSANHQKSGEKHRTLSLSQPSEGTNSVNTLTSGFSFPQLWDCQVLLKSSNLWYVIMAVLANEYNSTSQVFCSTFCLYHFIFFNNRLLVQRLVSIINWQGVNGLAGWVGKFLFFLFSSSITDWNTDFNIGWPVGLVLWCSNHMFP